MPARRAVRLEEDEEMFDPTQKTLALEFARALVRGDYPAAHAMCGRRLLAREFSSSILLMTFGVEPATL